MPISLILTPFDHFQICPTFAVNPNLILEPCPMQMVNMIYTDAPGMTSHTRDQAATKGSRTVTSRRAGSGATTTQ